MNKNFNELVGLTLMVKQELDFLNQLADDHFNIDAENISNVNLESVRNTLKLLIFIRTQHELESPDHIKIRTTEMIRQHYDLYFKEYGFAPVKEIILEAMQGVTPFTKSLDIENIDWDYIRNHYIKEQN